MDVLFDFCASFYLFFYFVLDLGVFVCVICVLPPWIFDLAIPAVTGAAISSSFFQACLPGRGFYPQNSASQF